MSDIFAAASAAITASALGIAGTYTPAEGQPMAVRLVPSRPEEAVPGFEGPRAQAIHARAMIAASDLPARPQRGDALAWGDLSFTVAEVVQDPRGASFTLHLRRA
jgi:hypothetical protein